MPELISKWYEYTLYIVGCTVVCYRNNTFFADASDIIYRNIDLTMQFVAKTLLIFHTPLVHLNG